MNNMFLCVATDSVNSMCSCDMGVSEEEWNAMTEEEQKKMTWEFFGNVAEMWISEGEPSE